MCDGFKVICLSQDKNIWRRKQTFMRALAFDIRFQRALWSQERSHGCFTSDLRCLWKLNNINRKCCAGAERTSRGPCFIEATDEAGAHGSSVCVCVCVCARRQLTIAEMAGMPPAKVRDSRGAQWTYFPSTISGSNVPEGGWPLALGTPTAPPLLTMQRLWTVIHHTCSHSLRSTLCPADTVPLLFIFP